MKIKIVSDGVTTQVLDATTGSALEGVQMVNFMSGVDGANEALLHVMGVQCEIYTEARSELMPDGPNFEISDEPITLEDLLKPFDALELPNE